jgi:glycosyltransferase involved in cell wall biosynthesis
VEVSLNGGPPEPARVAMDRGEIKGITRHPDAPISAWEHRVDLAEMPDTTGPLRIDVTAHAFDGREHRMNPVTVSVGPPRPPYRDLEGTAWELRNRSADALRPAPFPSDGSTVRLVAFTHLLVHGGASLYLYELLRRLVHEPGFHCEVVTLADGPLRQDLEALGIRVHVTNPYAVTSVPQYEGQMAELLAWSASRGFNAALVNSLGSFVGGDLAGRLGIPAVWAVHESSPLQMFWHIAYVPGTFHPYVQSRGEQALASAAATVFEAEATRRLFLKNADPERLVALPYAVELEHIDAAIEAHDRVSTRRRLGIAATARVLLCLGSIEPRKSQAMLVAAFAKVADRHPDALLVLVGETDHAYCAGYRVALREYIARAGLEDRVRVVPNTEAPFPWHAVADALVCASDIESLPRAILEAMAFGTPVLSTRVFGVPEVIEDGRTGYLCEMRDVADLARGLERVLGASAADLQAVGRAGSEYVRAEHRPDAYAETMLRLLRGFVATPDALPGELLRERERSGGPDAAPAPAR